jgi:hypothetical protein
MDLQREQLDLQRQQLAQQATQSSRSGWYVWSSSSGSNTTWLQFDENWAPVYNGKQLDLGVDADGNVYIKNANKLWLWEDDIRFILSQFKWQTESGSDSEGESESETKQPIYL